MRIGVDSYSYHRLLGLLRPGETPAELAFSDGLMAPVEHARSLGCDVVSVQTCFLAAPGEIDRGALTSVGEQLELVLAWGAPNGLEFGRREDALDDLVAWIELAGAVGCRLMRIVVGGPALRGVEPPATQVARSIVPVRAAARHAARYGLALAVENHGDIATEHLSILVERVAAENLGLCFDTGNAARVGEDPVETARRIAARTLMVHLKDVESPERTSDPISGPCSVAYGEGVVPVEAVLDALAEPIDRGSPVCVELGQLAPGADELRMVADGVEWLRARSARARS